MEIALVTDTHAGVRNDHEQFQSYQQKSWNWFFDHIDKKSIKHIIHLGDIYERRQYVNFTSAMRLRLDFFEQIENRGIETHIIAGNHDMYYKNTHVVNALEEVVQGRYKNIKIHTVPNVINIDGLDIQLLPFITQSNYEQSMEAINNPKAPIAMGHLEINGFVMHKGEISKNGIDARIFEKFDQVYSGHFHHRSTIGNINYIGALGEYTWLDYNDPRGFSIFNTKNRKVNFFQNPFIMFEYVIYDDVKDQNIIETIQKTDFSKYSNKYIKLIVEQKENSVAFDLFYDKLEKAGPLDINTIDDTSVLLDNDIDDVDQKEDTPTLLCNYIDNLKMQADSSKMKSFMLSTYKEALQTQD